MTGSPTLLDRCLHRLALQPATVRQFSFDLERLLAGAAADGRRHGDRPVYVCGLAGSGSTLLLRLLRQCDELRSQSARDMPFVLAPSLWRRLQRGLAAEGAAAAHRDGGAIAFAGGAAFEEVFWRTFAPPRRADGGYGSEAPSAEAMAAFAQYRALVSNPADGDGRRRRYLSRNSSNLARLPQLLAEPGAAVLIVYRNPVATARALHRMHLRAASAAARPFIASCLSWLGHHEYGPAHVPFAFAVPGMRPGLSPGEPDYWLDYWNAVYLHVLRQSDLPFRLVDYEDVRRAPRAACAAICAELGVAGDARRMARSVPAPANDFSPAGEFDPGLVKASEVTYRRLASCRANVLKRV